VTIHFGVLKQLFAVRGLLGLCVIMLSITLVSCDRGMSKDSKDSRGNSKEMVQDTKDNTSSSKEMPQSAIDEATLTYGYAPVPNHSVTYQPDVIFIEGGPHAIRSVSADDRS
jgi:hypothetical protein